jgi:hypothetical protein
MSLIKRLQLLEQKESLKEDSFQIAVFIVPPRTETKGYVCEGITTMRKNGESLDELQDRASQNITWPPGNSRKIFECLE